MKEKYIEKLDLTIYNTFHNVYGTSNYLDINFTIDCKGLKAISGTSCKYGGFEDLCEIELDRISDIINNSIKIEEII